MHKNYRRILALCKMTKFDRIFCATCTIPKLGPQLPTAARRTLVLYLLYIILLSYNILIYYNHVIIINTLFPLLYIYNILIMSLAIVLYIDKAAIMLSFYKSIKINIFIKAFYIIINKNIFNIIYIKILL